MTEKELVRRALLGDKQAQEDCTAKGIVLPCPLCGSKATMHHDITGRESYHVVCSNIKDMCNLIARLTMWRKSEEDALKAWNTRPAPPIGRCGECKNWNGGDCYRQELTKSDDFCSYFEPREE